MRHGVVILPDQPWSSAARRWRRAEELGFDHAWTFDHLMWRTLRDRPWYAAMPTLTAAATATSRLRLGTLVANPNIRHPLSFAKEVMTLDDISGGRLICGLGAGVASGDDTEVFGAAPLSAGQRAQRFEEFVELTDLLLRERQTSFDGRYYTARDAAMHPGCLQRPTVPLAIAAAGRRAMRLVARFAQSWITVGIPGRFEATRFDLAVPMLREQCARLDEACLAQGRDPADLERIVVAGAQVGGVLDSADAFATASGLFGELGFTDLLVFWPRPEPPFQGSEAQLEAVAALLSAAPAGASR
jgi:alkanesulfonate monooxygenase SsuD/methylene tetrahydromethanopterin reductase-like flavin-dependent oxidoreductase (luciferase family)